VVVYLKLFDYRRLPLEFYLILLSLVLQIHDSLRSPIFLFIQLSQLLRHRLRIAELLQALALVMLHSFQELYFFEYIFILASSFLNLVSQFLLLLQFISSSLLLQ